VMAESKPATQADVMIGAVFVVLFFFLSAWLLWQPTRDAVQRIEQKVNQCQP
jgi:small-conductance mechanosensitive channel